MPFTNPRETIQRVEKKSEATERLKKEKATLNLTIENLNIEIEALLVKKNAYDKIQKDISSAQKDHEGLLALNKELEQKNKEISDTGIELNKTHDELTKKYEKMEKKHEKLLESEEKARKTYNKRKKESSDLQNCIVSKKKEEKALDTNINNKKAEIDQMEGKIASLESKCVEFDKKQVELAELKKAKDEITIQTATAQKDLAVIKNNALIKEKEADAMVKDALKRAGEIRGTAEKKAQDRLTSITEREGRVAEKEQLLDLKVREINKHVDKAKKHFGFTFPKLVLPK